MYYFYFDNLMLPVPPPSMQVQVNNKNKTVNLINEGEINIIKTPGLTEVSFEIMLPNQFYPFAFYGNNLTSNTLTRLAGLTPSIQYAKDYVSNFEELKTTQKPFRFIVTRMTRNFVFLSDTNLLVTLEDYSVNENADNGFDWQIPLTLKQYKPYATKELKVTENADGTKTATLEETRFTEQEIPTAYETTRQMTAWEVCKRASGGSLDWRQVADLNNILNPNDIVKDTRLIFRN